MTADAVSVEEELLSAETVGEFLSSRGLVPPGTPVEARTLGGGVSNVVLSVDAGRLHAVVKQSLPKLRVADDWPAKRERTTTEANALRVAGRIYQGSVPQVIASFPDAFVLVIARAPDTWQNYKELLLSGEPEVWVAERCGTILAKWHAATWDDEEVRTRFHDEEAFEQLRIDPYYRTVARRRPEVAATVQGYIDRMLQNRRCLVHGDFSPKNVLFGTRDLWIVDFETAHFGDPVFDLAFMLNHLILKSIHRPEIADKCLQSAEAFLGAYAALLDTPAADYLVGQTACLLLARVDGKSPAEYLTEPERVIARSLGDRLLSSPGSVRSAWAVLGEVAA